MICVWTFCGESRTWSGGFCDDKFVLTKKYMFCKTSVQAQVACFINLQYKWSAKTHCQRHNYFVDVVFKRIHITYHGYSSCVGRQTSGLALSLQAGFSKLDRASNSSLTYSSWFCAGARQRRLGSAAAAGWLLLCVSADRGGQSLRRQRTGLM